MARAIVRFGKTHVSVLCPIGHLICARFLDRTWGGSWLEAEIGAHIAGLPNSLDRQAERCDGAGHEATV
jgi:hypothetical protein